MLGELFTVLFFVGGWGVFMAGGRGVCVSVLLVGGVSLSRGYVCGFLVGEVRVWG